MALLEIVTLDRPTADRIEQLRQSVKGYRELEKAAAEFRGRAAMIRWAHAEVTPRFTRWDAIGIFSDRRIGRDGFAHPAPSRQALS